MCPHTDIYVSACYYICVLLLLCMCPYTDIYVSSYRAAQSYTPQDVAVIMNALAHHAMRDVALTRHLATAWAAATAPATVPPPAEGAAAAGGGVSQVQYN